MHNFETTNQGVIKTMNNNQKPTLLTTIILLSITPLVACAAGKYQNPEQHSNEPSISIKFDPKGGVSLVDKNGRPLTPCAPACTAETAKKYGKRCPETNPKLPVCKGLSDASVADVTTFTIIESTKNPYCYTSYFNGSYTQVCYDF